MVRVTGSPEQDRQAMRILGIGLKTRASSTALKEKYRELAQIWHPDRHMGGQQKALAEAEFKRIGDAFKHLEKRLWVTGCLPHSDPIDPFHGVPWYHHTRYPPWSFLRGPPYVPSAAGCAGLCRMHSGPALDPNGSD